MTHSLEYLNSDDDLNNSPDVLRADTLATRVRILRAAEQLFSEGAIDAVSLQQIGRDAGQRNRSAVQYHFGDKEGVLVAILDRHTPAIAEHRNSLLDEIEERGEAGDLRRLAEAFVLPVARRAQDPDGGMAYVQISAQLIGHPQYTLSRLDQVRGRASSRRLTRLVATVGPEVPAEFALPRLITVTGLLFHGIADWSRVVQERSGMIDGKGWDAITSYLVDTVAVHFSISSGLALAKTPKKRRTPK
jgi:AcrR family transcriptional regulator